MPHVSFHILQSMPPNNINRDDSGAPKSSIYGGARRASVSGPSWKRAARIYTNTMDVDLGDRARRTRNLQELVRLTLTTDPKHADHAAALAQAAVWCLGLGTNDERPHETKVLVFATDREVRDLSAWASENHETLLDAYEVAVQAAAATVTPRRRRGRPAKTAPTPDATIGGDGVSALAVDEITTPDTTTEPAPAPAPGPAPEGLARQATQFFRTPRSIDTALYGRMLAEIRGATHDGALSVAHAISTHRVALQTDYFTAADDLTTTNADGVESAKVGMIGETLYQSAVLYRYACLDVPTLAAGLDGDIDLLERAVAAFLEAFMLSMPSGKQHSFAAHTPPTALAVTVDRQPINLAGAFLSPIEPRPGVRLDADSWDALCQEWRDVNAMTGRSTPVGYLTQPSLNLTGPSDQWPAWDTLDEACQATARAATGILAP